VRFLIDGAAVPADANAYDRVVVLFDGQDAEALADARACWSAAKAQGFAVTYWQADRDGRWQRVA
jgi:DNA polymerase-3 subunit chi